MAPDVLAALLCVLGLAVAGPTSPFSAGFARASVLSGAKRTERAGCREAALVHNEIPVGGLRRPWSEGVQNMAQLSPGSGAPDARIGSRVDFPGVTV